MKQLLTIFGLVSLGFILFSQTAAAVGWGWNNGAAALKGSPLTQEVEGVVGDATSASRPIAYGIGGLGAVALGALAFFGRFQWGWFFGLVGGLALIGLYNVAVGSLGGGSLSNLNVSAP
jgi:hypothetical protein